MYKGFFVFASVVAILIGIGSFMLEPTLNVEEKPLLSIFQFGYWLFVTINLFLLAIFYNKIDYDDDFIFSLIPIVNFAFMVGMIIEISLLYSEKNKSNRIKNNKYFKLSNNKMTKKYPQLISLNALKEIYDTINESMYVRREVRKNIRDFKNELQDIIIFLEKNYQTDEYYQLLIKYEISFIKCLSIFKDCIANNEIILDDVLNSSIELLEYFLKDVEETQKNIEKAAREEKLAKNKINTESKEKTKERYVKEIQEEIDLLKNKL
jgi:hypothetical protein